jgi:ribonuclease Z
MTPLLHPFLVNDRFGDPALYVEFLFEKRALLFDLGDLHGLETRKILRLSDIFVSHAHIDHFIGFDRVLRVLMGRDKRLRLFGPAGFIDRVAHRLGGYTWNLVDRYASDLVFTVMEVHSESEARTAEFHLSRAFRREAERDLRLHEGLVLDDGGFKLRAARLDHRIPCLGFAVEEQAHVNVWKNRLDELGLPTGPWLRELKQAVLRGEPEAGGPARRAGRHDLSRLVARGGRDQGKAFPFGAPEAGRARDRAWTEDRLRGRCRLQRGQPREDRRTGARRGHPLHLARDETARAAERCHLTTEQAGRLARLAGVRRLEPFHFSPRYAGQEERLRREVEAAFRGVGQGGEA